jgi:hypothetical protein
MERNQNDTDKHHFDCVDEGPARPGSLKVWLKGYFLQPGKGFESFVA